MDTKYNGWANYETWCVALWLNNEEASYRYWRDAARQAVTDAPDASQVKNGVWSVSEASRHLLAEQLRETILDSDKLKDPSFFTDLLRAAIDAVDWQEIAVDFLEGFLPEVVQATPTAITDAVEPRFSLGRIALTPGALATLAEGAIRTALERHGQGDWGLVDAEDAQENLIALKEGFRLFSVYEDAEAVRFWVITEADRSITTILLPSEY